MIIIRWYDWASSIGWSEAKSFHNRSSHTYFDFASLFSLYVIQCAYYCPPGMCVAFDEMILIDILWWARVCASYLYDCITPSSHSYQLQYNIHHLPACAWTSRIMCCVHIFQVFHWTIKIYGVVQWLKSDFWYSSSAVKPVYLSWISAHVTFSSRPLHT